MSMLGQRVVTAVVLLALLVPALFAPLSWPFDLLTLALIGAAGWEWGRLNRLGMAPSLGLGLGLALACAAALRVGWSAQPPVAVWWLAAAVWVFGGAVALRSGPMLWPQLPLPARLLLGLAALWAAWSLPEKACATWSSEAPTCQPPRKAPIKLLPIPNCSPSRAETAVPKRSFTFPA